MAFLLLTVLVLLNNKGVQQWLTRKATTILSTELNTHVSVEYANFKLFNEVALYNVVIEDRQRDTLLVADELSIRFSMLPFLKNRFIFHSIRLKGCSAYLKNDVDQGNNFDFIIEALKSKDENKNRNLFYRFSSIQLTDCNIQYVSNRKPPLASGFDVNNIDIRDLNVRLSVKHFTNDSFLAVLRSLKFKEKSGLDVQNISARITANHQHFNIEEFNIRLPRTDIKTGSFYFEYEDLKKLNRFTDSVNFNINLKPSKICLGDLGAFVPAFKPIHKTIGISGVFYGPVSKLSCPSLQVTYGKSSQITGNFSFTGLPDIENTYVSARVSNFHCTKTDIEELIADIKNGPVQLPAQLKSIEKINFKGQLNGYLMNDLMASGSMRTNLGDIDLNMSFKRKALKSKSFVYYGEMQASSFELGNFLDRKEIGNISFNIRVDGQKDESKPAALDIKGIVSDFNYKNYAYSNIGLNGFYNGHKFEGEINIDDENGQVNLNGLLDFSNTLPYYDFTAKVKNLQLGKMNLATKYPDMIYSFNVNLNASGNNLDNIMGNIYLDSVSLVNGDKELYLKKFEAISDISENRNSIVITSDFINGAIEGKYTMSTIVASVQYVASQYLPALNAGKNKVSKQATDNNFDFDLKINDLDTISTLLGLNWKTSSDINLYGYYDDQTRKFRIKGLIPFLNNKNTNLSDISFLCENPGNDMRFALDFKYGKVNKPSAFDIYFRVSAKNDSLVTAFEWNNNGEDKQLYSGNLFAITKFSRDENQQLITNTDILPTNTILLGSVWNIHQSNIITKPGQILVHNFGLANENQGINIDGIVSKNENDNLNLQLQNIPLGYLREFIYMDIVLLDGLISGNATVSRVLDHPIFQADLGIKDFTFNNSRWGDLALLSTWEREEERLKVDIKVADDNNPVVDLAGYVYPKRNIDVDIIVKAQKLKLDFLQPFLGSVLQNVQGIASCKELKMLGPLTKPLFEGNVMVNNGSFDIDFLRTKYSFSDTIRMTPHTFSFKDIAIYDVEKNSGKVSGNIRHDSYKNFVFNINGRYTNLLGLNTQKKDNDSFYGKAYGTGSLSISGNSQTVNFNISVKTEPNTRIIIPFSNYMTATENNFITFIERPKAEVGQVTTQGTRPRNLRAAETSKSTLKVNLQLDATPDAEVQLIIDSNGGDMIKATGNGNLRVEYNEAEGMKLYGNYTLASGFYNFTLQNILRKDFKIKEGSSITWSGSPYTAQIDINAYYSVRASLLDLFDESTLKAENIRSSNVNVNCLLNLTGELTHPNILFDLEFPGSNDDLARNVKSIINTEMNQEILYLLSVGRFYKPEYMRSNSVAVQSSNAELSSLVSSTLSAQLNNWLSQINSNVSMGFNYYHSNTSEGNPLSTEVEVQLGAEMFNNRLVFNGNVGYRDDVLATSNFIGDFDLEYKLNKSGKLRAKAYSHSNDKYYEKNTTTQGAGIIYREEFDNFHELLQGYWNKFFKRKERKEK